MIRKMFTRFKSFKNRLWISLVGTYLVLGTASTASAQATTNPFDTSKIISDQAGDTMTGQIGYYIAVGGKVVIAMIMVVGVGVAIARIVAAFQATEREGWGQFGTTIAFSILLLAVMAIIANFAWGWAEAIGGMFT